MLTSTKAVIFCAAGLLGLSALVAAPAQASPELGPTPTVIASIPMQSPGGLAYQETNDRIIVSGNSDGVVRVVNAQQMALVNEIPTNVAGQTLVQVLAEANRAYVLGSEPIVSVIDTQAASLVQLIPMSPEDVNATGSLISQADVPLLLVTFAPGASPGAVALISTVTNFRRGTLVLPYETAGMVIPRDRLMLVMASPGAGSVLFLDTFFQPFNEVAVGGTPIRVIASVDGSRIYVSNPSTGRIDVIDADTFRLVGSIAVGEGVLDMALAPGGRGLAALIPARGEVVNVDLTTAQVVSRGKIATDPVGITFGQDDRVVYVADKGENALLAVDLIHERPAAVTNVRVTAGKSNARVTWRPSQTQGTAPVARYRVTALPKAGSCTTLRNSCTISKLKPGRAYRFQVVAETEVSQSPATVSRPVRIPRS